jgi:hypothetical protein
MVLLFQMTKLHALKNRILLLILFGFVVLGLLLILFYKPFVFQKQKHNSEYYPGFVLVTFNDEISYQEAVEIVQSLELSFPLDDPEYKYFHGNAYAYVENEEQFGLIAKNLKKNPKVISVEPANVRIWTKNKIKIVFDNATESEVKNILNAAGLRLDEFNRRDSISVGVPVGKEQYYLDQFKLLPGVKNAQLAPLVTTL